MPGDPNSTEVIAKVDYSDIPPELRPKQREVEAPEIPVVPQNLKLSQAEVLEIEQRFSSIRLTEQSLKELKNLGIHLQSLGVSQLTQANMFVNQHAIAAVLAKIAGEALQEENPKKRLAYAQPLGYLSGQLSRAGLATKEVGETEDKGPKRLTSGPRHRTFRPGEDLQPPMAVQINNYLGAPPTPPAEAK